MDHIHSPEFRAYIRHLTVTDKEIYEEVVKEASNYIFDMTGCDHIRVELHHFKDKEEDATIKANPFVKDCFSMAKKGYKWKTMINRDNGVRF